MNLGREQLNQHLRCLWTLTFVVLHARRQLVLPCKSSYIWSHPCIIHILIQTYMCSQAPKTDTGTGTKANRTLNVSGDTSEKEYQKTQWCFERQKDIPGKRDPTEQLHCVPPLWRLKKLNDPAQWTPRALHFHLLPKGLHRCGINTFNTQTTKNQCNLQTHCRKNKSLTYLLAVNGHRGSGLALSLCWSKVCEPITTSLFSFRLSSFI